MNGGTGKTESQAVDILSKELLNKEDFVVNISMERKNPLSKSHIKEHSTFQNHFQLNEYLDQIK